MTSKKLLADVDAAEIVRVSGTNVVGSLLCCREAIRLMRLQETSSVPIYHIFNMGFSRWGASFTKSACTHKSTKVALTQLTHSLSEELQAAGKVTECSAPVSFVDVPCVSEIFRVTENEQ